MGSWKHPRAFTSISDKGLSTICSTRKKIASSYFSKYPTIYRGSQNMIILVIRESLMNVSASTLGNVLLLLRAQTVPVLNLNSVA